MILYDLIGYTGMSKTAKEVINGTFLEKYGDDLGDILPKMEQVIQELSMLEEIKVLEKKIKTEILEVDLFQGSKAGKKARPLPHRVYTLGTTRP
jgi:hypothetical protein